MSASSGFCHSCLRQFLSITGYLVLIFILDSLWADGLHHLLHQCERSRFPILQRIGYLHTVHHRYLDSQLQIHPEYYHSTQLYDNFLKNLIKNLPWFLTLAKYPHHDELQVALMIYLIVDFSRCLYRLYDLDPDYPAFQLMPSSTNFFAGLGPEAYPALLNHRIFCTPLSRLYHYQYPDRGYSQHFDLSGLIP